MVLCFESAKSLFLILRNHIETFRITQKFDMWHLHLHEGAIKPFSNLTELAKSIKTQAKQKFRLAPSEYGMLKSDAIFITYGTKISNLARTLLMAKN